MHPLRIEEKAALLLAEADDDEDQELDTSSPVKPAHEQFSMVTKRPKTSHPRRHAHPTGSHPVLCFTLILGAFILGCVSGVVIMFYRMSQDAPQGSSMSQTSSASINLDVDASIQTKLSQSIIATNFLNINRSLETQTETAANQLVDQWNAFSGEFVRTKKVAYEARLAKPAASNSIEMLEGSSGKSLSKVDGLSSEMLLSFTSLIGSRTLESASIYYVNYGREEDLAHLFQSRFDLNESSKPIVFMRRNSAVISVTEQVRQALRYRFSALILFDDHEDQRTTTNDRLSFFDKWRRFSNKKIADDPTKGKVNDFTVTIPVLTLAFENVQSIFASLQPDSNSWSPCPPQWHPKTTSLKLGGALTTIKLRLTVNIQEVPVQLPVVITSLRSSNDPDRFVLVGYQLGNREQQIIVKELVATYVNQMKNGWKPRRSILLCAWSGTEYDHFTVRRWLTENSYLINRYLIAYLDLGNGVMANGTLNLHGSALLEQVAHHAAEFVVSPLKHDHTCHHRVTVTPTDPPHGESHHEHDHGRRRRDGDHHDDMLCEPHKLLDEWIRNSNTQIGLNRSLNLVQMIDAESSAALAQLQYGIPSLLVEMTNPEALTNETFYARKTPPVFDAKIEGEVYVAYTQFLAEVIRPLIDEPLIPFNLTLYADQLDRYLTDYFNHYQNTYHELQGHLGDRNESTKTFHELTKSMRETQSRLNQWSKTDFARLFSFNEQLIGVERLFVMGRRTGNVDATSKHVLFGPAVGLTNTAVPLPSLSNLLFNIPGDPPGELCDTAKLLTIQLQEDLQSISRTLKGLDGLLIKNN